MHPAQAHHILAVCQGHSCDQCHRNIVGGFPGHDSADLQKCATTHFPFHHPQTPHTHDILLSDNTVYAFQRPSLRQLVFSRLVIWLFCPLNPSALNHRARQVSPPCEGGLCLLCSANPCGKKENPCLSLSCSWLRRVGSKDFALLPNKYPAMSQNYVVYEEPAVTRAWVAEQYCDRQATGASAVPSLGGWRWPTSQFLHPKPCRTLHSSTLWGA